MGDRRERRRAFAPGSLAVLAPVLLATAAAAWASLRFRRFAIAGNSMLPTLAEGDWVLVDERAYRGRLPRRGHIVIADEPRPPGRQLVKRVEVIDLHRQVMLAGDNPEESTDSRHFGPVRSQALRGRVRWRYWPVARFGPVR